MITPEPISIIIPAHNESTVISRCLRAMLDGAEFGEFDILVVCNGCTDDTADRARSFGEAVRVIELEIGSKPLALRTGDAAARYFPRFYVDADIVVSARSLRASARILRGGDVLAAAPSLATDLSACSTWVRRYYAIWTALPYVTDRMIGSGIYGLSEQGRSRFENFPDIIGDDAYIRLLFRPEERASISTDQQGNPVSFTIFPPASINQLVRIETRRRTAQDEMVRLFGPGIDETGAAQRRVLRRMMLRPCWLPGVTVYLYVKLLSRYLHRRRRKYGQQMVWLRDESSR